MQIFMTILQALIIIAVAPLISGIIRKIKNNIRMRKGAGIFQPYYNLAKLFAKGEVISEYSSWIFRIAPFMAFGSSVSALLFVPFSMAGNPFNYLGDLLAIIFLMAFGRFFMALAALDTASPFGGMGSSREMFISSLVEPVTLVSVFAVAATVSSTNPSVMAAAGSLHFSSVVAAIALVMAIIAETSRIPIDNQETHLELTMIHEAMALEYSGRSLALIELASYVKQMVLFLILTNIVLPGGILAVKIFAIIVMIAVIEISIAKMRLFRAVDYITFALVLSIAALVISAVGL